MATSLTGFSLIESIPNNSNGNGWETGHKWTMSRNSSRIFVNEEKEMNETYWISVSDMYFLLPFFMPFMVKPLTRFMDLCGSEGAILDCTLVFNETNRTFETNDVYQSTRFVCQSVCMSVCMCVCVWVSACVLVCVCVFSTRDSCHKWARSYQWAFYQRLLAPLRWMWPPALFQAAVPYWWLHITHPSHPSYHVTCFTCTASALLEHHWGNLIRFMFNY